MPVPYRRSATATAQRAVAYVKVVRSPSGRAVLGALLLLDARGRPLEFVHNRVETPTGFLWPEAQVDEAATTAICHSLFDACTREPDLLLCEAALGSPEFCASSLAPTVPFGQVTPADRSAPAGVAWINDPPRRGMAAAGLAEELQARSLLTEPFERAVSGLREVYPEESWPE